MFTMKNSNDAVTLSKKAAANRRNAQLSTGPRTTEGKRWSRQNALKHGILASAVLIPEMSSGEGGAEFDELLSALRQDREPMGVMEDMWVEKIAVCWWRQKRALHSEAVLVRAQREPELHQQIFEAVKTVEEVMRNRMARMKRQEAGEGVEQDDEKDREHDEEEISDHCESMKDWYSLPLGDELDRIIRYETAIQRQLLNAINQLERLQRARKGEHVPAPVSVQLSRDE